jgi:hypothetical protein
MLPLRNRLFFMLCALLCVTTNHALPRKSRFVWDWRHTQELDYKQTLEKSTALTAADKAALRIAITKLVPAAASAEQGKNRTTVLKELFADLRIRAIDLNGDGVLKVIAQPSGTDYWCGATGNCTFWVFQKVDGRFKLILDSHMGRGIGSAEVFNVLPEKTMGYSDLMLGAHDSASEKTLIVYRYDGQMYRPHECYDANWMVIENNEMRNLKEPQITACVK